MPDSRLAIPALLFGSVLWGLSWMPLRALESLGISGLWLIVCAYSAAAFALGLRLAWRPTWRPRPVHIPWLLALAALGGIANVCFTLGILHGEVVRVMLLFYLVPAWGVLGGWLWLGERLTPARLAGLALALSGALVLLGGPQLLAGPWHPAELLGLIAGLAWASANLLFRHLQVIPSAHKNASMLAGASLLALLIALASASPAPSPAPAAAAAGYGVLYLLSAALATQWAVHHLEAGRAAILMLSELLVAVVTATWIGGERLTGTEWLGAALIFSAALLETRPAAHRFHHPRPHSG